MPSRLINRVCADSSRWLDSSRLESHFSMTRLDSSHLGFQKWLDSTRVAKIRKWLDLTRVAKVFYRLGLESIFGDSIRVSVAELLISSWIVLLNFSNSVQSCFSFAKHHRNHLLFALCRATRRPDFAGTVPTLTLFPGVPTRLTFVPVI